MTGLAQDNQCARECGMSYGKWRGSQEIYPLDLTNKKHVITEGGFDLTLFCELYNSGLLDRDIATRMGCKEWLDGCQTCQDKSKSKDKSKEIYIGAPAPSPASPAAEIIGYLNEKAGTRYKSSSKTTQRHINARLEEGFTIDDFRAVIDKKCAEWLGDAKFQAYLRPETLFGTKFESYLNAPERSKNGSDCGNPGQEWGELDGIKRL